MNRVPGRLNLPAETIIGSISNIGREELITIKVGTTMTPTFRIKDHIPVVQCSVANPLPSQSPCRRNPARNAPKFPLQLFRGGHPDLNYEVVYFQSPSSQLYIDRLRTVRSHFGGCQHGAENDEVSPRSCNKQGTDTSSYRHEKRSSTLHFTVLFRYQVRRLVGSGVREGEIVGRQTWGIHRTKPVKDARKDQSSDRVSPLLLSLLSSSSH